MMKSLLILLSAGASTVYARNPLAVNVSRPLTSCGTSTLSYSGDGPFKIEIVSGHSGLALETFNNITTTEYQWRIIEPPGSFLWATVTPPNNQIIFSYYLDIVPGNSVPQQPLPSPETCFFGDHPQFLRSDSTCASLTTDGSTIYTDSSTYACCDRIPAGTFICTHPARPDCQLVPTNPAATTSCLGSDRAVTVPATTNCDFLDQLLGTNTTDFYTISGHNICCDDIPAGTTVCLPNSSSSTTTAPPSTRTTTRPPGYLGCYDDTLTRTFPRQYAIGQTTIEECQDACSRGGFAYTGLKWGDECWCGNNTPIPLFADDLCNIPCAGNSQEMCGGGNGISVYKSGLAPSVLQSYDSWSYAGCYEDFVTFRAMSFTVTMIFPNDMTVEGCLDECKGLGYGTAGVEYSQECYCGEELPALTALDDRCNMPCKGDGREICGGGVGLTVYQYSWEPVQARKRNV